jgi:hypothetical protein
MTASGGYPRSVGEDDLATLKALDLRHDARAPCLEGLDEAVIDRGADELPAELRLIAFGRTRDPERREVPEDETLE